MDENRGIKEDSCNIMLENRRRLSVSGVIDVDSFDEENVVLMTELGALIVKGGDFRGTLQTRVKDGRCVAWNGTKALKESLSGCVMDERTRLKQLSAK